MTPIKLTLASASPARLKTLQSAGVFPQVLVSGVDERAVTKAATERFGAFSPADTALLLAQAKAEAASHELDDGIVIGCDSILEMDGKSYGRPKDAATAIKRIKKMSNNSGTLHTGHWLIDLRAPENGGTGATVGATGSTIVHFGDIDEAEIEAYVETGEPLQVAGSFTVDGLGGPYISGIEGDYHNVVGLSLPLVRELLNQMGVPWRALRSDNAAL